MNKIKIADRLCGFYEIKNEWAREGKLKFAFFMFNLTTFASLINLWKSSRFLRCGAFVTFTIANCLTKIEVLLFIVLSHKSNENGFIVWLILTSSDVKQSSTPRKNEARKILSYFIIVPPPCEINFHFSSTFCCMKMKRVESSNFSNLFTNKNINLKSWNSCVLLR